MNLSGKVAIVTGGASGFGAAITAVLEKQGAMVAVFDLKDEPEGSGQGSGGLHFKCDVVDSRQVQQAVDRVVEELGRVDILINNAGWSYPNKPAVENSIDEIDKVLNVNIKSVFLMSQAVVPVMRKHGGGTIINIGSATALRPIPGLTWYAATKAAINLVTKTMALELAADGIRVNCVAPGLAATALFEAFVGMPDTEDVEAQFAAMNPTRRLTDPIDVANACAHLASDDLAYINGVILPVDGGASA
ncbi:SDR family oxidoreductase [Nocardia sp. NPDC055049]